jgi:heme exporter protein CcmD
MNFAPFIDGSYGVSVVFLLGISWLTLSRYRRARKRLAAVETRG